MTWTKLSDDFSDECWTLSDAAFRLLVEMLNYSNRRLLDCRIPKDEMRRFAKRPEAVQELVEATYVHDRGDAYEVAFQSLYQPSRVQVLAIRDRNAKNGKKGGRPKGNRPRNPDGFPDGNPEGRDGTGQDGPDTTSDFDNESRDENDKEQGMGMTLEQVVNETTGEVFDWPVARIPQSGYCSTCGFEECKQRPGCPSVQRGAA